MTVTYTLRTPIEHNGTTYQTLTFREATTGDLIVADKFEGPNGKLIATFASMADVPLPVFKQVPMRDFNAYSDEAGRVFRREAGQAFQFDAGRCSDLKPDAAGCLWV